MSWYDLPTQEARRLEDFHKKLQTGCQHSLIKEFANLRPLASLHLKGSGQTIQYSCNYGARYSRLPSKMGALSRQKIAPRGYSKKRRQSRKRNYVFGKLRL